MRPAGPRGEAVWCAMSETPQTAKGRGTSVAPMLSVQNGARAVEFYQAAFGAQVLFRHDDSKAGVVARLSLGKSDFWLADESPEHSRTHYFPRIRLTNSFINRSASEARQTRALSGNWS